MFDISIDSFKYHATPKNALISPLSLTLHHCHVYAKKHINIHIRYLFVYLSIFGLWTRFKVKY